ncbi:hypothetical protein [Streptomyces syringium]|uniref:hypothetical protein n=1 Tax=Streptomyces syringium TaxID=76729 RepID=UPI0034459C86
MGWGDIRTQLVYLPVGELAQVRWLREQELWTPMRGRATRSAATHDRATLRSLGFDWRTRHAAAQEAETHLARHWSAVLDVAERLAAAGRISGDEVCDVMNQHLIRRKQWTPSETIKLLGAPVPAGPTTPGRPGAGGRAGSSRPSGTDEDPAVRDRWTGRRRSSWEAGWHQPLGATGS